MKFERWVGVALLTAPMVGLTVGPMVGCGPKKDAADASDETEEGDGEVVTAEEIATMEGEGLEFDQEAAEMVMKRGARKVNECVKEGAVPGEGEITAVFDGPKGRIVDVELGTFDDGTDRGKQCIKNAFIGEIIPPFEGEKRMPWNIKIEEGEPEGGGKKQ